MAKFIWAYNIIFHWLILVYSIFTKSHLWKSLFDRYLPSNGFLILIIHQIPWHAKVYNLHACKCEDTLYPTLLESNHLLVWCMYLSMPLGRNKNVFSSLVSLDKWLLGQMKQPGGRNLAAWDLLIKKAFLQNEYNRFMNFCCSTDTEANFCKTFQSKDFHNWRSSDQNVLSQIVSMLLQKVHNLLYSYRM